MLPLQSDYSLRAVCRYCLCFLGWWRMKWPMMQLHTWLTWFRQTLVWPTCGEDNTASVCTLFTQHGALTQLSVLCKSLLVCLQVNQQPVHCGRDQAARWGPRSQQSTQRDMVSISSNWHLGLLFSPQGYVRPSRGWVIIWSPTYSGHKLKLVRDGSVTVRLLNALLSLPTWTKTEN